MKNSFIKYANAGSGKSSLWRFFVILKKRLNLNIMEVSIFFAQLWGWFYIVFGALFIITGQLGRTIEMTEDKSFVISTGYISFLMGLVTVILHNIWVLDWRLIITVLAWSTMIKGIMKIGFPEQIRKQAQRFKKKQMISAVFLILLGLCLVWLGFTA